VQAPRGMRPRPHRLIKEALIAFQRETDRTNDARWLYPCRLARRCSCGETNTPGRCFSPPRSSTRLARQRAARAATFALGTGHKCLRDSSGELRKADAPRGGVGGAATEATGIAADPVHQWSLCCEVARRVLELIRTALGEAEALGEGIALTIAEFLSGGLFNALGRLRKMRWPFVLPASASTRKGRRSGR